MAKKMCVVAVLAVLAVFTALGVSSEAKVMKFEHFSIDVPSGWQTNEDKENLTTSFVAPDNSAALTVAISENEGASVEEYAGEIQKGMNGKNLQKSDDGYHFQFTNANGVSSLGIVSGNDEMILFMTVTGEHDAMDGMINSMEWVD